MSQSVIETDVIVIGAGPVALFAAFECGHLGLKCHLVDSLPRPGGQCTELYPEKPILDIPGIPLCTGQELVDALMIQAAPFEPQFHLDQQASELSRQPGGQWLVTTTHGTQIMAPSVVIAAGVGSFEPRKLKIPGTAGFEGKSLRYAVRQRESHRGKTLVIAGGGDSALDWVLDLEPIAKRITLVHRRPDFRAVPATAARVEELIAKGRVDFRLGAPSALTGAGGALKSVSIKYRSALEQVDCDSLLVFYGLSPSLGPIAKWGLNLEGNFVPVNTENFESRVPGIFAIGDICTYPGKLKLLLSGFHESALMARQAFRYARPDESLVFRHTTSDPELQALVNAA